MIIILIFIRMTFTIKKMITTLLKNRKGEGINGL